MVRQIVLLISSFFLLNNGCGGESSVTGSEDVRVINNVQFTITEKVNRGNELYIKGIVKNSDRKTITPTWYVEGDFYSDNTYSFKLGGDNISFNYSLAQNESTSFQLRFSSSNYDESQYPSFAVKNLRAYYR